MNEVSFNPPPQWRKVAYAIIMLGGPIMAYLQIKQPGIIGDAELVLWAALTTTFAAMAGLNVTPSTPPPAAH